MFLIALCMLLPLEYHFARMRYEDFVKSGLTKSDDELLRLRANSEDLTQEASLALSIELARRKIDSAERLNAFRDEQRQHKEKEEKNPGSLFVISRLGIGRWYFGKADLVRDPDTNIERFRTTVFILILWFPLIPTGAYLVEENPGFFRRKVTILEKLPLDWSQILRVWGAAALFILSVVWIPKRLY